MSGSEMLDAALEYAAMGLRVFPLRPKEKVPLARSGGCKDATCDETVIREWWEAHPDRNVGIATGGGVIAIDVDVDRETGEDGFRTVRAWEKKHEPLARTAMDRSGRGGAHLLYWCPDDLAEELCSNSADKTLGVDIRGEGGYIVAPPSVHPNGSRYEWAQHPKDGISELDGNVAGFIRMASKKGRPKGKVFELPERIREGERNDTLTRYACSMQSLGWDDDVIFASLVGANATACECPLPEWEVEKIFQSVTTRYAKGERSNPRPNDGTVVDRRGKVRHNQFGRMLIDEDSACFVDGVPAIWDGERYDTGWDAWQKAIVRHYDGCRAADQKEIVNYMRLTAPEREPSPARLIAFQNGVFDVERFEFVDAGADAVITNIIPHDLDLATTCADVDRFLDDVSCGDATIRANLEEVMGVCMYRSNEFGQCAVLLGGGSNGKSTYLNMVRSLLGHGNVSSLDIATMGTRFQAGRLVGKLANIGDDIPNEFLKGEALSVFKKVVTGDWIYTDVKNGEGFEFKPYCTMVFSCNEFPNLGDSSEGVMRRLFPIPFDARFDREAGNCDPRLIERLTGDDAAKYLCNLAMMGLARVIAQGGFTPNGRSADMVDAVRVDNNNVLQWIEDEGITAESVDGKVTDEVFEGYRKWCEATNSKPFKKQTWSKKTVNALNVSACVKWVEYAGAKKNRKVFCRG